MADLARQVSKQLLLTPAAAEDADELYLIHSDPRTWEHAPAGRHTSIEQTKAMIHTIEAGWHQHGLDYWTARDRRSDEVVGIGGVRRRPNITWNLYYRFAPRAWGRGLATELGRAALEAAHTAGPDEAVVAWILDWHLASQRVALRLGMTDQGIHTDPHDHVERRAYADRPLDLFK